MKTIRLRIRLMLILCEETNIQEIFNIINRTTNYGTTLQALGTVLNKMRLEKKVYKTGKERLNIDSRYATTWLVRDHAEECKKLEPTNFAEKTNTLKTEKAYDRIRLELGHCQEFDKTIFQFDTCEKCKLKEV